MCGSLFEKLLRTGESDEKVNGARETVALWSEAGREDGASAIEPALLQRFGRACLMAATAAQLTRCATGVHVIARGLSASEPGRRD